MRRLLLIPILALGLVSADALAADGHSFSTFNGRISGIDSATITARDGNHTTTCFLTSASPSLASFSVGQRVALACRNKVLVTIALKNGVQPSPSTQPHSTTATTTTATTTTASTTPTRDSGTTSTSGISGTVTALSSGSLTVHDGDRDVTCSLGSSSPSVAGYAVGSHVKIGCANGVLTTIAPVTNVVTTPELQAPGSTTGPVTTGTTSSAGASGAITALSATSITVNVEHPVTCALGPNAASTAGYKVGDVVKIGCLNGLLYYIVGANGTSITPLVTTTTSTEPAKTPTTTTTTTTTTTSTTASGSGTITALSSTSVTVTGDRSLTCSIGSSSPNPASYGLAVGAHLTITCVNSVLTHISTA